MANRARIQYQLGIIQVQLGLTQVQVQLQEGSEEVKKMVDRGGGGCVPRDADDLDCTTSSWWSYSRRARDYL